MSSLLGQFHVSESVLKTCFQTQCQTFFNGDARRFSSETKLCVAWALCKCMRKSNAAFSPYVHLGRGWCNALLALTDKTWSRLFNKFRKSSCLVTCVFFLSFFLFFLEWLGINDLWSWFARLSVMPQVSECRCPLYRGLCGWESQR